MKATKRIIQVKLDTGAKMPTRAHKMDAGLDLYSREEKIIPAFGWAVFDTGVHVKIPAGYMGLLFSKSGLNIKKGLTSEGIIDYDYTGSITVKLYNFSHSARKIEAGQKISQLIIVPCIFPEPVEVEEMGETERGDNGFGSTGDF